MSLEKISQQISSSNNHQGPPVELWDPPYCGEIDLVIKADGSWFYNGTIFKRQSLVKLFASVLKKEQQDYYLVTPVEKVKITVEDAPFLLTKWHWQDDNRTSMKVATNLGDEFVLDSTHPLTISDDQGLYVVVRRNLVAKVHRNVYYQWADIAIEKKIADKSALIFTSNNQEFVLGYCD